MITRTPLPEPTGNLEPTMAKIRELDEAGEYEVAERMLCEMVASVRGGHAGDEEYALHRLAVHVATLGRMFEALAVGRAWLAAVEGRSAMREAGAIVFLCRVLRMLDEDDAMQPLLERLANLGASDPTVHEHVKYSEATLRCLMAIERGDASEARASLDRVNEAIASEDRETESRQIGAATSEARILTLEGRYDEVNTVLDAVERNATTQAGVATGPVRARFDARMAAGDVVGARVHADRLLQMVGEHVALESAVASSMQCARQLARYYAALPDPAQEQAAVEVLADAMIRQLFQLDACMRKLADIGIDPEPARSELIDYRKRFQTKHSAALHRLAELFEAGKASLPERMVLVTGDESFVAVCAWCESVRSHDGSWMPVGQFLPRTGPLRLTHAICEPCAQELG